MHARGILAGTAPVLASVAAVRTCGPKITRGGSPSRRLAGVTAMLSAIVLSSWSADAHAEEAALTRARVADVGMLGLAIPLPILNANQAVTLAARAYELGEGDLASMLLVRREAVDTQAALLDAEQAHANAEIELLVAVGRMPQ